MKPQIVIHEAEEGGYRANDPASSGCATQGETFEESLHNIYEAVQGCLSVSAHAATTTNGARVTAITVLQPVAKPMCPAGEDLCGHAI